jgi:hypothetical protein
MNFWKLNFLRPFCNVCFYDQVTVFFTYVFVLSKATSQTLGRYQGTSVCCSQILLSKRELTDILREYLG